MAKQSTVTDLATIGGRIRATRLARNLSATEVAKQIRIARPTLFNWETDATGYPAKDKLEAFSRLTNVPFEWLLTGVGDRPGVLSGVPDQPIHNEEPATVNDPQVPVLEVISMELTGGQYLEIDNRWKWDLPRHVLAVGLNSHPGRTIVLRVVVPYTADGMELRRGDYALIDLSRTEVDDVGIYMVNRDNKIAWGTVTADSNGKFQFSTEDLKGRIFGRVTGIVRPV